MGLEIGLMTALAGLSMSAATVGAGYGIYQGTKALSGGGKKASLPGSAPSAPSAPSFASASEGAEGLKKTARRRTSTILTSPLRGGEEFGAAAPTLLGSGKGKKLTGE